MALMNVYLNFNGKTEEAFNFYKSVLGGEFMMLQRFKEGPDADKLPPGAGDMILHISLPVGANMLMGTDAPEAMGFKLTMGNNFHIFLGLDSEAEVDRVFKGLSDGGNVTMPLAKMFWGAYFGSFTDKYGVNWMLSCALPS